MFTIPKEKVVELDEIGSDVVRLCEGKKTVREISDHLAKKLNLNRREAEASLLTYLNALVRRGVLALAVPEKQRGRK